MAYVKQTWADDDPTRPLSAARMNHIEDGIADSGTVAVTRDGDPLPARSTWNFTGDGVTVTDNGISTTTFHVRADSNTLWNAGDRICTTHVAFASVGTATLTSGQPYAYGGPGMVVPAGVTVRSAGFISSGAAVSPSGCWFFLAIPDETGSNEVTVVATSQNAGTTAWAANAVRKLSFRTEEGGSGEWTPLVDTPVYAGIVQIAGTPATLRGSAASGFTLGLTSPKWWGTGPGGLTTPASMASVFNLGDVNGYAGAFLSNSAT